MRRREFLGLLSSTAMTGLVATAGALPIPSPRAPSRAKIRAICFDLFTIFDPRSVVAVAQTVVPSGAAELCEAWRARQFEYSWLRVAARRYVDFRTVTYDALVFAEKTRRIALPERARQRLVDAYSELEPWPDTRGTLSAWKRAGLRLAPLSNYSPSMLERLVANSKLGDVFDVLISSDRAKTFKPDPRAYALGVSTLDLDRAEIAFCAFGGWDAAGAKWFGYPTFWVNRLGVPSEELLPPPDGTGPTLAEFASFLENRPG
jgi:2-haloacid dehalogenase